MIGLDTSFLIDFFKGEEEAVVWMEKNKEIICISELVIYEFLCGNLTPVQEESFLGFVSQIPCLRFDRNTSIKASQIFRDCRKYGNEIPHPDAMIAGSYIANSINKIVTMNKQHFSKIKNIKVITY